MRDYIVLYINGKRHRISGAKVKMTLAQYLRQECLLTGTKVVCAEGDCGACTVLIGKYGEESERKLQYRSMNSCISFLYLLDLSHIITVEGVASAQGLHPVQEAMVQNHGAQCGYCTPGFVTAMVGLVEDCLENKKPITEKKAKNYLTGNLCRCTGYKSIIKSALGIELSECQPMSERYHCSQMMDEFSHLKNIPVKIETQDIKVNLPCTFQQAFASMESETEISSGATDLGVLVNKGRKSITKTMSLNNIPDAYSIKQTEDAVLIGPKVNLSMAEKQLRDIFPEFTRKLHLFASPQIKNKGTLVGNVINASPIADSIPFFMVAESELVISNGNQERIVNVNNFFKGYKQIDLKANEIVLNIRVPKTKQQFKLYKVSVRKDLDISIATFAARYEIDKGVIKNFSLALGGVAATVIRMPRVEAFLKGKKATKDIFKQAAELVKNDIQPISDHRASAQYRKMVCHNLMLKFYDEVFPS